MALSAGVQLELRNGGSDTNCSGGFDPSQTAGMYTDGAATSANTSAPVFSSASYNFVAGDVGAYVFIGAGTNWTKGWYPIVSVASNVATLGAAALGYQPHIGAVNTSAGCASVASPTGATWSIDYSQQDAARNTFTDLTFVTGTTFTSATVVFGKQLVGNVLKITGGTNYTAGSYVITGVTGTTATLNGTACSGASSDGAGSLGGAYASIGSCGAVMVAGNILWIKYSATPFTTTSASSNVSNGRFTGPASGTQVIHTVICGYNSVRGDNPTGATRPELKWGVNAGSTLLIDSSSSVSFSVRNIIVNGNRASYTNTGGIKVCSGFLIDCKITGCSYNPLVAANGATILRLEWTNCSIASNQTIGNAQFFYCDFHDNTAGILTGNNNSCFEFCIFDTNGTGPTINSINNDNSFIYKNCIFYGNTGTAVAIHANGPYRSHFVNCIFESNTGWGISMNETRNTIIMMNCAFYNNTSGKYTADRMQPFNVEGEIIPTTSVFVDAANRDFRLNMKTGGGALLRGGSWPSTFGNTMTHRQDIGAHQHSGPKRGING